MKNNWNEKIRHLFFGVLIALLMLTGSLNLSSGQDDLGNCVSEVLGIRTVQAATKKVSVKFLNSDGKKTYSQLAVRVKYGSKVKLPQVPSVIGYVNLGWSTSQNDTKAVYAAGKTIRLRKNMTLYAVRKKTGTSKVYFYDSNGKTSAVFRKLNQSVTQNAYFTLPSPPEKSGYEAAGWALVKGADEARYTAGKKVRIKKNTRFYAVYKINASVTLCKNDGSVYQTVSVVSGTSYTLPSVRNASGYTFMGWDTQPGKQKNPRYEAGQKITVNTNLKLYAVVFNREGEEEITASDIALTSGWRIGNGSTSRGYSHVIFVGDSRTERTELTLKRQFSGESDLFRDIDFVYASGKGLDWLKETGLSSVLSLVEQNYSIQRPTAVIFNLGVNDPGNMYEYVTYLKSIADTLQKKNCKLFFMSVNPVNSKMIEAAGKKIRTEEVVRKFNNVVSSGLAGTYTYIDAYTYLMQNGYGTNAAAGGVDVALDDGLHYTTKTYKRIFRYCLEYLASH